VHSSVAATISASRSLPFVSSWAYSSENSLAVGCESRIDYFGFCFAVFGLHGATPWSSLNQIPLSLASGWLSVVLAPAIAPKEPWQAKDRCRGRSLIRRMVNENSTWGAPRIHGELLKLGFDISERTVSRYLRRLSPPDDARKRWSAFLHNHRDVITAMDFLTVPTLTFRVLYCFFVIEHGRRKILHFNVTEHPTGPRIVQQLRAAFPESCAYRYAILDRDGNFGKEVTDFLTASGLKPTRISPASPWQNGIAERWIGSCRRDLLNHVLIFNKAHLRRLVKDYVVYYQTDRTHDGLEKDTPATRPVAPKPAESAQLVSFPRIGGLHHRYDWQQAA